MDTCPACGAAVSTERSVATDGPAAAATRPHAGPPTEPFVGYDDLSTAAAPPSGGPTGSFLPRPDARPAGLPVIPGFELFRKLGGGGMGEVYRGLDAALDRAVAVKVIKADADQITDRMRYLFVREGRTLAAIRHDHVVQVYEAGVAPDGTPYLVMEYVDGPTLSEVMRATRPDRPDRPTVVGWLTQLADGVAAVHAAGIVHRDLKPSNTLLTADGVVKVADFGLAVFADATRTRGGVGTVPYLAPEQWDLRADADPAADVWSLGVTLYEGLVGRRPFDADDRSEAYRRAALFAPPAPHEACPDVPVGLSRVVMRCLEKDPALRYPSAGELAADLRAAADAADWLPVPVSWRRRAARFVRRHRAKLAAGVAAPCLAAAFVLPPRPADQQVAAAPTPEQERAEALNKILARLRAGEQVALVGRTGLPAWHDWRAGAKPMTPSAVAERACEFESNGTSLLELLPPVNLPDAAGYTLSAEIMHQNTANPATENYADVGLYTNYHVVYDGQERLISKYSRCIYSDFWKPIENEQPELKSNHGLNYSDVLADNSADGAPLSTVDHGVHAFVPSDRRGVRNEWRRLTWHVTRHGTTTRWRDDRGRDVDAHSVTPAKLAKSARALDAALRRLLPTTDTRADTSFGGLGIYCRHSLIAFRNVSLQFDFPNARGVE